MRPIIIYLLSLVAAAVILALGYFLFVWLVGILATALSIIIPAVILTLIGLLLVVAFVIYAIRTFPGLPNGPIL